MKAIIHSLGQVLYSPSQYVIPVFQRHYRWELPQWQRLWDSLEEIQQPGKTGNHFMGFLVYVVGSTPQPGQPTRFHLIDGQQRLTTLSLLLASIRNVARRTAQEELAQEIHEDYLVHPRRKGEQRYRLLPKEHDQTAYLAIVDDKPPAPGRMAQAVAFFERMLHARADEQPAALRRLFEVVCQRLDFMGATLESENAYSIFKSLNSTGVPLSQADLIRNFVFMHVPPDAQDEFDAERWNPLEARFAAGDGRLDEERFARFFRDLLMADGQYVPPKLTFATFEARHEATGFAPDTLAAQLAQRAEQYAVIGSRAPDSSVALTRALARLNRLDSSTTFPLLLWLFAQRDAGQLDDAGLARAVDMLCGFILRRFVAGETSRGYGEMFVRAIRDSQGEPVAALEQFLLQRGWPEDARFIEAFTRFPLYKRGYAREVLEALELARGHKEQGSLTQAQIEHILPQTLSDDWADALGDDAERVHGEWLHRPGNLTLSAYNQEVGNQGFTVKRARFAQSNISLTREVGDYPHWGEAEILERGERMAMDAAALWQGPKEAYAAEADTAQEQEARSVRLAFWTGFAEHLAAAHSLLPQLVPESKRVVRLQSGIPHLRLAMRYKLQDGSVALLLRFKPKARAYWHALRDDPELPNGWVGQAWEFDDGDGGDALMTLECVPASKDSAYWPALYDWLAVKLALVSDHGLPWLREAIGVSADDDDNEDDDKALTPTRQRQLAFWTQLVAHVVAQSSVVRPQKPAAQSWLNISIGRAGFGVIPTVNQQVGRLGVEIMVAGKRPKEHFKLLLAQKGSIEQQLGFELDWMELPDAHQCRIVSWRNSSHLQDQARWPEYVEWMADRIIRMDGVFRPLVKQLP
ncbi:hypothetical protein N800_01630 [Lysobacter daejeonensis GH1-9]|uniref:DUF4268 domain-containing protein n=1 Tax=Lysobacter daejeonensis GH1-9 TaxID=1385517 RepID=A0A0A0EVQ0_9GAMM|nr:DUF4268 domain-containing protein [Lysobacter daejeonensis]KGM55006.1 hypothetical protein N800_01630 [Lysobacter daejeonensis GH1-9]